MQIDLVSKLTHDYLASRLAPNQKKEDQNIFFTYENQTLEIYSIMEGFDGTSVKFPNAKAKRIKSKGIWKVYCMGQSMKWELYKPHSEVKDINEFLKLIDKDKYTMFWG
ncbi:MAG: DUF3024 domain-containing protein [Flavobacteriaceae bacterium]|nr:MAG: DUF3024 domain-containing protein [Flavobacteriaceae bacterium]